MATYGRNRQSMIDIEEQLNDIFHKHPQSQVNDEGNPSVPGDALVDVFRAFSEVYNGVELMTSDEMDMMKALLASNPGLEVTPQILLQFIAARSKHSPHDSPESSPSDHNVNLPGQERGRTPDRDGTDDDNGRSSSSDSAGASFFRSSSRPPSRGPPHTPMSASHPAGGNSPFDTSKRQRSTPLGFNAPSSWAKRPTPAHRRRSDAGQYATSDSEFSGVPSSFKSVRNFSGRSRPPSNPTSPKSMSQPDLNSFSTTSTPSRPHSRSRSQPQTHFLNTNLIKTRPYGSPSSPTSHDGSLSPTDLDYDDSFMLVASTLTMPRSTESDSDSDAEDTTLGLVLDRSTTSSTVSMEPMERLDALQRNNAELSRKLMDAERTLQNKLSQHELELEEMQGRLEEVRSELSATKREEKELRAKERTNSTQISALESEIGKLQKSLDNARASYQSLQKQYQEQCAESERHRNTLRQRDQEIKEFKDGAVLQHIETQKWIREHDTYEERLAHLSDELAIAQQASAQLDEQKQENLMLKETIDRMRFDMDEMRNNASGAHDKSGSGASSATGSMSKTLGAELMGKMMGTQWNLGEEVTDESVTTTTTTTTTTMPTVAEPETVEEEDEETTEGEDVVQTIITRKKRKVPSRAVKTTVHKFEEIKEYSDAYVQHELDEWTSPATTQTDPAPRVITSSFSVQTDPELPVLAESVSVQTDEIPEIPAPATLARSVSVATEPEEHMSRPSTPALTMASSSFSTLSSPNPKGPPGHFDTDLPPAYNEDDDWGNVADVLKKFHPGVDLPIQGVPGGISDDALEGWKAFREEMGMGCMVMEKMVEKSERAGPRRDKRHPASGRGRFYNIYNTYVYGKDGAPSGFAPLAQVLMCVGASAVMFLFMTPYMVPHYSVPGGPTYYDRSAWASFNTMQAAGEGFAPDGTNAVWSFLGTIGGGAARIVRGWPT